MEAISPEQVSQISGYLDTWEDVSFDDKRRVVDLMITTIAATDDPQVWGVATLKQWIDGYETTRFTEIDDRTAVITYWHKL